MASGTTSSPRSTPSAGPAPSRPDPSGAAGTDPVERFRTLLAQGPVVLDGAMSTELERRGTDTSTALWSAVALEDHPDRVQAVHEAYFQAGAQVATTNTYQANIPAFRAAGRSVTASEELIRRAVTLAQQARDAACPEGWVAGSVGPYGAYLADGSEYTGDYALTEQEFQDFHRPRLRLLVEAGADVLALETMPHAGEVRALCALLAQEFPSTPAWVSFSVAPGAGAGACAVDEPASEDAADDDGAAASGGAASEGGAASVLLRDGTPLAQAGRELAAAIAEGTPVVAVGVNCLAVEDVAPAMAVLREATGLPLVAYPNAGERYDPTTKTWVQREPAAAAPTDLARDWAASGARLVGGCCRTSPADIAGIRAALEGEGN